MWIALCCGRSGGDILSGSVKGGRVIASSCVWGCAEEVECNHPELCSCLTLRFPLRIKFQVVWPSQVAADYFKVSVGM